MLILAKFPLQRVDVKAATETERMYDQVDGDYSAPPSVPERLCNSKAFLGDYGLCRLDDN
jgi:hypothetical protein